MGRAIRAFAFFAVAVAASVPASGRAEAGDGVHVGEWVFRPSIESDIAYQTNVLLLDRPSLAPHPDDWIFRLVPQLVLERSGGRARVRLTALYDWRQYAYNPKLDAHDNFGISLSTAFDEDRDLAVLAEDNFRIQSRPNELDLYGQYHRDANSARLSTIYRPGTALEVRPGAFWDYDRFTGNNLTFAERHIGGVSVDARWAFLSRTVFALYGEGGRVHYSQSPVLAPANQRINSESVWWRAEGGLVGQVSPKVNIALKGGYGQALYQRNESLNDSRGMTATARAEWGPRHNIAVTGGYERSFQDVFFTNFDVIDRVFAKYRHGLRDQVTLEMAGIGEWQQYSRPYARHDFVLRLDPSAKKALASWADLGLAYRYERRFSKAFAAAGPSSADAPSSYTSHTVMFTANLKF